jgi:hypothetical protein
MDNETIQNSPTKPEKAKRAYHRKQPVQVQQQPAIPNPTVVEMESGLIPLVKLRLDANAKVRMAVSRANQANLELSVAQSELQNIEGEINYRMQLIGQLKNGGMPVPTSPYVAQNLQNAQFTPYGNPNPSAPYNPVVPFPTEPYGVSSMPAPNRGLYPDATDRLESAEDIRQFEIGQRGR